MIRLRRWTHFRSEWAEEKIKDRQGRPGSYNQSVELNQGLKWFAVNLLFGKKKVGIKKERLH